MTGTATSSSMPAVAWLKYGLVFILPWTLLTEGNTGSWAIGIVVVPLATWCAMRLFPPVGKDAERADRTVRIGALVRFIPFFLEQSLKGGWESALLAIHPERRVHPGFMRYTTRLPPGRPRLYFVNFISLVPGTLSADWRGNTMTIHALDSRADNFEALRQCETRIAALFGLSLDDTAPGSKTGGA